MEPLSEEDRERRLEKRRRSSGRGREEESGLSPVEEGERKKQRVGSEPQAGHGDAGEASSGGAESAAQAADEASGQQDGNANSELHSFRISFEWRNQEKAISYEDLREQLRPFLPNVASVEAGRTFGEFHAIIEKVPVTTLRAVGMAGDPQISCSLFDLNLRLKGITTVQEGLW